MSLQTDMSGLEAVLERTATALERLERMEDLVMSTDPRRPGIAMRLDRIEQVLGVVKWIAGGGLVGLSATLLLLWRIAEALTAAGGG